MPPSHEAQDDGGAGIEAGFDLLDQIVTVPSPPGRAGAAATAARARTTQSVASQSDGQGHGETVAGCANDVKSPLGQFGRQSYQDGCERPPHRLEPNHGHETLPLRRIIVVQVTITSSSGMTWPISWKPDQVENERLSSRYTA